MMTITYMTLCIRWVKTMAEWQTINFSVLLLNTRRRNKITERQAVYIYSHVMILIFEVFSWQYSQFVCCFLIRWLVVWHALEIAENRSAPRCVYEKFKDTKECIIKNPQIAGQTIQWSKEKGQTIKSLLHNVVSCLHVWWNLLEYP